MRGNPACMSNDCGKRRERDKRQHRQEDADINTQCYPTGHADTPDLMGEGNGFLHHPAQAADLTRCGTMRTLLSASRTPDSPPS